MMKFHFQKFFFLVAMCLGTCGSALASPFMTSFSIAGFDADSPLQSITGNITWEASSISGPIDHLTSIDLEIFGHKYAVDELRASTYDSAPGESPWHMIYIGGVLTDYLPYVGVATGTNDFWISWHSDTNEWEDFAYSASGLNSVYIANYWQTPGVTQFDVSPVSVPEPGAWALLMAALLMLGGQRTLRNRFK